MFRHRGIAIAAAGFAMVFGGSTALADQHKPIREKRIWHQRWSKASDSEKDWVKATGSCESGNNPSTNTGNGYLGALQFDPPTWWAAPNTGPGRGNAHQLPHQEPLLVQRVVAIKKVRHDGSTAAWPVCG